MNDLYSSLNSSSYFSERLIKKENELKALQRNMDKWKHEVANKMVANFDEELEKQLKT